MKYLITAVWILGFSGMARSELVEQPVEYAAGDVTCEGWHVYDKTSTDQRPGVLIVHQWTGISDYEKRRARELAERGFNVLVADVYGKGVRPQAMQDAAAESSKFKTNRALLRERLLAAHATLVADPHTQPDKVAAIGYCFGGTAAIELARAGAPIQGAISFHGGLDSPTPADGQAIRCELLVLHGDADPIVPQEDVAAFEAEMQAARVNYELVRYPGVVHAFTQPEAGNDPSKGVAYDEQADKDSFARMEKAFARWFAKP